MCKSLPLVSIVIPSFNHAKFIQQCIESIYIQTYKNFELYVIDDGSNDGSRELLQKLQQEYSFHLEFQKNLGLVSSLNRGFKDLANGKYLTFCASDDYWLPEKLHKQVEFMEANPECGMVYGKALLVDQDNRILNYDTLEANKFLRGGYIFNDLILKNFHPPVNYLLRASVVKELGYYRENIWAEDFDMNLRIAAIYPIGFIDDFLIGYRRGANGKTKMLTYKTVFSHLESINLFKESPFYKEAIYKWNFRCFLWYCTYKESKLFALKGMLKSMKYCHKKEFIASLVNLFLKWE